MMRKDNSFDNVVEYISKIKKDDCKFLIHIFLKETLFALWSPFLLTLFSENLYMYFGRIRYFKMWSRQE